MQLNFIGAEFFGDIIQLIIAIFTFLIALGTLYITCLMYETANKALKTWRNEKVFDIEIEGIARAFDANQLVHGFFDINENIHSLPLQARQEVISLDEFFPMARELETALKHHYILKEKVRSDVNEISLLAQKIIAVSNNDLLTKYYNLFLIHKMKNYSDIPSMLEQKIDNLITERFGVEPKFNRNPLSAEALKELEVYYSEENRKELTMQFDQLYIKIIGTKINDD